MQILPYYILMGAIFSLWVFREKKIWFTIYLVSIATFFLAKIIYPFALIPIFFLWGSCYVYHRKEKWIFILSRITIFLIGAGFFLHIFPGIKNVQIVTPTYISKARLPYDLYLNFEGSLGFFLLAYLLPLSRSKEDWKHVFYYVLIFASLTIFTLLTIAFIPGFVRFDPKWPTFTFIWILSNLLLTAVSEEAFFRGFIQQNLSRFFHFKAKNIVVLLLSSSLFGVFHFRQGELYMILATAAGLFYGLSFLVSKRIEVSIFTHFFLNATHFFFFTYPM